MEGYKKLLTRYDKIDCLSFAFESQQPVVCDFLVRKLSGRLNFLLLRVDIPALGYVIGNTSLPVTELRLQCWRSNDDDDDGITALLQALQFNKEKLHNHQVLAIHNNLLNGADVTLLASVLKACTRITRADLSFKF